MSADEFDADIERLFSRSAHLADAEVFAVNIETRLYKGSRVRALALTAAGLVGGVFAVRESLDLSFELYAGRAATGAIGQGLQSASHEATSAMVIISDLIGLSNSAFGSMGGLQLFWVASATVLAMITVGIMKLSEEA